MSIKVHQTQMLKVSDLNPVAYNPRTITPEKYEALKANIVTEGFLEPIVVQKKGHAIIGGHQRYRAVKEIAVEAGESPPELPCIVLDIDDVRAKKLNVKLNSLTGDFESRKLGELLVDLYEDPKTLTPDEAMSIGFAEDEALKHIRLIEPSYRLSDEDLGPPTSDEGGRAFAKAPTLSLEFATAAARDKLKAFLKEASELEKRKSGDVVAAILLGRRPKPKAKAKRAKKAAA